MYLSGIEFAFCIMLSVMEKIMNSSNLDFSELRKQTINAQNSHRTIYNHDIINWSSDGVKENHLCSGRALGLSEPGDIIQLHPELESEWGSINHHYHRIGLPFTESVIWNTDYEILTNYPRYDPSVCYLGRDIYDDYGHSTFFQIVNYINSKNNFVRVAQDLELPILQTFCYEDKTQITDTSIFPYPCYLKSSHSDSETDVYRCKDQMELFLALTNFSDNIPLQIQEDVNSVTYLTIDYRVNIKKAEHFAITEYSLDDFQHKKISFPSLYSCWEITDKLAEYLYFRGMKGVFGFNVAVVNKNSNLEYKLIDCMPRFSHASYSTWIAKKLGAQCWVAEDVLTNLKSLSKLDLKGIEYNSKSSSGIVLINWGTILMGKLSVLFVGSPQHQVNLKKELMNRIS